MTIPNQQQLQEIAFNYSSDTDFKDLMNFYKKYAGKSYSFLVIDATVVSYNHSHFGMNLLEKI